VHGMRDQTNVSDPHACSAQFTEVRKDSSITRGEHDADRTYRYINQVLAPCARNEHAVYMLETVIISAQRPSTRQPCVCVMCIRSCQTPAAGPQLSAWLWVRSKFDRYSIRQLPQLQGWRHVPTLRVGILQPRWQV
jgi:hypothetical protein